MKYRFSVKIGQSIKKEYSIEADQYSEALNKLSERLTGDLKVNLDSFRGTFRQKKHTDIERPQVSKVKIVSQPDKIPGLFALFYRLNPIKCRK